MFYESSMRVVIQLDCLSNPSFLVWRMMDWRKVCREKQHTELFWNTRLLPSEHKNYAYVNQPALLKLCQSLQLICCKEVIWNSIFVYWVRGERHNSVFCTGPWIRPRDCIRGLRVDIELWWNLSEFYWRFERRKPFQARWHINFQIDSVS